jgi:hypothetical protein
MKKRTVDLAKQLLATIPRAEIDDLVHLLKYFNRTSDENLRVNAMQNGFLKPDEPALEQETRVLLEKAASSQDVYMMTTSNVCKCCGK